MAHNLEIKKDGSASFVSMNESAWHRLGHIVSDLENWHQIADSFMNWEIDKIELKNPLTGEKTGFFGLFRDDTCQMLHVVKSGYEVIQNKELFQFINALQDSGEVAYETAGVLGNGEKVFVTALTGESDILGSGDIIKNYILGTTSHDGSLAETYKFTGTRVVCNNTLNAALSENGKELKFKHTKNAAYRKQDALRILEASKETAQSMKEKFEILAQRIVSPDVITETLGKLFKVDFSKIKSADDLTKKQSEQISIVNQLFEVNDNDAFPQFRGTAYNFLNAITEYADHYKDVRGAKDGQTSKQQAYSALFGSGDKLKTDAMELILDLTKDAKSVNQPKVYSYETTSSLVSELLGN